jgi:hypothetical protein
MNAKWIVICVVSALWMAQAGMGASKDPVVVDVSSVKDLINDLVTVDATSAKDKDAAVTEPADAKDPTLVAWWQLDETSGDEASDSSPGQQHGQLKGGPAWTRGYKGGALNFDGKDDYVAVTKAFYNRTGIPAMTVAAWIRTSSPNYQVIISFDRNEYWDLEINGTFAKNGQVGWSVMTNAGQINLASHACVNDGRWHHVAGVFDNGLATIYVDGLADGTKKTGSGFGSGNKRYGFLGVGSNADKYDGTKLAGSYFAGDMDDVRIYSRALTSGEIAALSFFGPANDDCQFAEPTTEVTNLAFDTTEASTDGQGVCMHSPNLWYLYAPSATGVATVSLLGSQYDTMLSIYQGAECYPGSDRLIGCNDDFGGLQSQLTFNATVGQLYLIEVGGWSRCTGHGVLTISLQATATPESDLGDAPDSSSTWSGRMTAYPDTGQGAVLGHFPTVFSDGTAQPQGPKHCSPRAVVYLGPAVSLENEANTGPDEDRVNNINRSTDKADQDGADDGLVLPLTLNPGEFASFQYIVTVRQPVQTVWVNAWFDWNRDGDWDDDSTTNPEMTAGDHQCVSEWAVQNQYLYNLSVGTHSITAPAFLVYKPARGPDKVWMRITLSDTPWRGGEHAGALGNGGSGPAGGYEIGETEDYLILPQTTCSICKDYNDDGQVNLNDLIAFLYQWLDQCEN